MFAWGVYGRVEESDPLGVCIQGSFLVSVVYIYPLHFLLFDKWLPLHRAQVGSVFFGLLQSLEGVKDSIKTRNIAR